jgi:capsular exopolysaccharide synthesis family protein
VVSDRKLETRQALVEPGSPSAEAFRTLRLALQLGGGAERRAAVVVTSAEPGAGKSTTAANLAVVSALARTNVLLIDADLKKPAQHEIFGLPRSPGLVDFLAESGELDNYLKRAPGNLDVLTAGRAIARSSDVTSTVRMAGLLDMVTSRYDLVIVDTPPVLATADVEGIAAHSDVEIVLVVDRASRGRHVAKALRRLELINGRIAGLVLNRDGHNEAYGY